jgi:type III pantothenate kinase
VKTLPPDLLAIEVGSSCVKLGWFPGEDSCTSEKPTGGLAIAAPPLPDPAELHRIDHRGRDEARWTAEIKAVLETLDRSGAGETVMASVHPAAAEALRRMLAEHAGAAPRLLRVDDLPLVVRVNEPNRVGSDRLLGAVAANRLRQANRSAVVVDMGTATTVNFIAVDGAFEGGAILPGPLTALRSLHQATASLPSLGPETIEAPPPIGKSTLEAMASGAIWGAVGAVQELVARMTADRSDDAEFFLTGGASHAFADVLRFAGRRPRHVPHLNLAGIKLVAGQLTSS